MARTIHALVLAVVLNTVAASATSKATGMRSLLGFTSVEVAPAPAKEASQAGFVLNSLPPLDLPIPGQNMPLQFTITIFNTTDISAALEEPAHCTYCLQSAAGCMNSSQGPLVVGLPPSAFAQVNFSVPVFPDASVINLLRPENGTILAYQPSPGGEPEAIINQINYDQGNGTAIAGYFVGYPIPGSMGGMEALTSVSFTTQKNATIGYTIPLVAGLASNATESSFITPSCYINVYFVVEDGPATLAPGAGPATLAPGVLPVLG